MTAILAERQLEYTVAHLCAGIGFGALGFARGHARVGRASARFRTLFGLDVDPIACADFERIVGAPCHRVDLFSREQYIAFHGKPPPDDWVEFTAAMLRALSPFAPDVGFWSPPCKGLSSLLNAMAAGSARYQALNELVIRALELALEAWADNLPALFLLENVPRIQTRGRALLDAVKLRLELAGYACAETVHDCGELGGLAQHRQRFLLVARHRGKVRPFLYEPDRRPVRGVGEVIGGLPLPDAAGVPMHALPRLQWRTWVRLALIEAGSDWRSLNKLDVTDGYVRGLRLVPDREWHRGALGVCRWEEPAVTVTGESLPSNGEFSVADPRAPRDLGRYEPYGVIGWEDPSGTVTSEAAPGAGGFSVADPRVDTERQPFNDVWRVVRWDEAAGAVTAGGTPSAGGQSVADPRLACKTEGEDFGSARHYGVLRWTDTSPTITGAQSHDNSASSVADPRAPSEKCAPWIVSLDGTRHRPFTTLELAALQGYPLDGILTLQLGGSDSKRREHIGNGVPVPTAEAIASTMLHTLLLAAAGQSFTLSAAPIWVDRQSALALAGVVP